MIKVKSAMKFFIFLVVCFLPAQIILLILFQPEETKLKGIIIGIGFGECETHMLHSFLYALVSEHVTFQGIPGCQNWTLTKEEIPHLDKYINPDCGDIEHIIGDVSMCNIKYLDYILNKCSNANVIFISNGKERDMQAIRKWILSFNELPWLRTNLTAKRQTCYPYLQEKEVEFMSFNDLVGIFYNKYMRVIERIRTKYRDQFLEISSDIFSDGVQNLTSPFVMTYTGQQWAYPRHSQYCTTSRTPAMLHAPHGSPHRLGALANLVKRSGSLLQPGTNCPSNLLFIFVDNTDPLPLLKRSVINKGCRYVHLGLDLVGWSWTFKIKPILRFLQRTNIRNDTFIISSDAADSALVRCSK